MLFYAAAQVSKTLMQCQTYGDTAWVITKLFSGRIMYMAVCRGRISTSANKIRRVSRNCTVVVLSFFKSCMTLSKASESWWTSTPTVFHLFLQCLICVLCIAISGFFMFCRRTLLQERLKWAHLAMSGHIVELAAAMILRAIQNCLFVARLLTVKHETICTLSCYCY